MSVLPQSHVDKKGQRFTLRAYLPEDREGLLEMYADFEPKRVAQGLPPADSHQRERWIESVLDDGHHVVVEVYGTVWGHGMLLPFGDAAAELANFLHQSIRDRGIGTALNRALLDVGRHTGVRQVWLSVEPSNRPAVRSYEKVGFRRRPVASWSPELEMEVRLEAP